MTDVDAVTAFVRARLADEEHDAKAATHDRGRWRAVRAYYGDALLIEADDVQVMADRDMVGFASDADVRHAVRQDPAATLARVAALRALVDPTSPAGSVLPSFATAAGEAVLFGLAAIWRDHPDFRAEWVTFE